MKYKFTRVMTLTLSILLLSLTAEADADKRFIKVGLEGQGHARGTALIVSSRGPDFFQLTTYGLERNTRYTVFLTESPTPGALPAQFIGEFRTTPSGFGRLTLSAEIVRAFASANQSLEDDQGIADTPGAGGLANGANTIPLNWIRVYLAKGGMNVFGPSERRFGGGLALTSVEPLP